MPGGGWDNGPERYPPSHLQKLSLCCVKCQREIKDGEDGTEVADALTIR